MISPPGGISVQKLTWNIWNWNLNKNEKKDLRYPERHHRDNKKETFEKNLEDRSLK